MIAFFLLNKNVVFTGNIVLKEQKAQFGSGSKKAGCAVSLEIFHYQVLNLPIDAVSIHSVFESLL